MRLGFNEQIAADIGYLVQAVASIELQLDDLICLFHDRFNGPSLLSNSYPVQLSEKLKVLPKIADKVGFELPTKIRTNPLVVTQDFRQRLVHGKVIDIRSTKNGYRLTISKMGLPERTSGYQVLTRDRRTYSSEVFYSASVEIEEFHQVISALTSRVFAAGNGWPRYMPPHEEDPLKTDQIATLMNHHHRTDEDVH